MKDLQTLIPKMPTGASVPSYNDVVQMQIAAYNATPGELTGYDCPDCLNKGYIAKLANGSEVMAECRCMKIRDKGINLLREKYVQLSELKYALEPTLTEQELRDSVNYLSESGYINN